MSTTRSRVREPAPADQAPGYSAVLVHGLVYHLVSGDGAPDIAFDHGKATPISEQVAHRLATAATDLVTRGHSTDAEGVYSTERQKSWSPTRHPCCRWCAGKPGPSCAERRTPRPPR